jgi:hypothetical protein
MPLAPRQQRLLEIETARIRHAWAKAQLDRGDSTPALVKYLEASSGELDALKTANIQMHRSHPISKE